MNAHPFAPGAIHHTRRPTPKPTRWLVRIAAVALSFCAGYAIGLIGTAI